jgi:hypothetical protein
MKPFIHSRVETFETIKVTALPKGFIEVICLFAKPFVNDKFDKLMFPYGGATGGTPQLAPPPQQNLIQSIQPHNEAARGIARQTMPWALSKSEKKNYDDIFRNWDAQNTGFISGHTALEVFGASGLPKDDLARIWYVCMIGHVPRLIWQKDIGWYRRSWKIQRSRVWCGHGSHLSQHVPPRLLVFHSSNCQFIRT